MLTPMKIRPGVHVKVKPSTCEKLKLNPTAFFRVRSVLKALAPVQGMRNGVRGTMYSHQQVEIETSPGQHMFPQTGYLQCQLVGIEDVILATPEEMTPPKRHPVDRVAVLLRLRRDFCLREGHYPTVDHAARAAAREEAKQIAYWANFQEKLEPFNPVFDRLNDRFVVAAHGPNSMTAEEHDEAEKRLLAREAAVEAKTLTFEALQTKGIPVAKFEWADLLKMKEEQVYRAMGLTADMICTLNRPVQVGEVVTATMIKDREHAKRAEFRLKFGGFSPKR